jgi:hypothetical protein
MKLNVKFPWPPIMPKQRECILFTELLINLPGASTVIGYHNLAVCICDTRDIKMQYLSLNLL